MVGYKKMFSPATQKAIEIVNSPKYGKLRSILAIYPMTIPKDGVKALERQEVINWLNNGVHPLSFMMAVGGAVSSVTTLCNEAGHGAVVLQFRNNFV